MPDHTPRAKLDIDWARTFAGALAAMSSAVLLSTLGAAGTLIGAAIGSLVATIGTALYAQGLARSNERARAQLTSRSKIGLAKAEVRRARRDGTSGAAAESHLASAEERLDEAESELSGGADGDLVGGEPSGGPAAAVGLGWRRRLSLMPWKRIVLSAAAAFLVTLIAIAVFEYIAGRSVSSYTGGSGRDRDSTFTGDHSKPNPTPEPPTPTPTPTPDPTDSLTPTPTPSDSLTPSEEPTVEPTDSPGPTPTELPTPIPTPTPTP